MSKGKTGALLLAAVLLLSGCAGGGGGLRPLPDGAAAAPEIVPASTPLPDESLDGHRLIARNAVYSLYLEEESLSILVEENATGRKMASAVAEPDENDNLMWRNFTRSGVSIEYYPGVSTSPLRADMFLKSPEKNVIRTEDGFAAHIAYGELGIAFDVIVTLTERGVTAEVPQASIREEGDNKLASLYLYPLLGYSLLGEREGYMLIPDGCGAVIDLKDHNGKYQQPYTAPVYGVDMAVQEVYGDTQLFEGKVSTMQPSRAVAAPVFGVVHTDSGFGFLGVVEKGRYNAEICAYPNGAVTQYNWVSAKFYYRRTYILPTSKNKGISAVEKDRQTFDARLRFDFVSGEAADYVGLALVYRRYLEEMGGLTGAAGPYRTRMDFLAGDIETAAVGTRFVPMTTVAQMEDILARAHTAGVGDILAVYKGWQPGGISAALPAGKWKTQSGLGSFGDLLETAGRLKEGNDSLLLYADFLRSPTRSGFSSSDFVYRLNEKLLTLDTHGSVHDSVFYFTPLRGTSLLETCRGTVEGSAAGFAADGLTNTLSAFRQTEGMISRQQAAGLVRQALETAQPAALFSPFDYLWGTAAAYLDFPLSGSDYKFVSREIPFFAIALSGRMELYGEYVNFQADATEFLLKMAESGVRPSYLLTREPPSRLQYTDSRSIYSSYYEEYLALAAETDALFRELFRKTAGASITGHSEAGGVAVTRYSNGCRVLVNYTGEPVTRDGLTAAPRSFAVG